MLDFFMTHAPTIATIGFVVAFCFIAFFALRGSNKKKFEDYSNIPLNDE